MGNHRQMNGRSKSAQRFSRATAIPYYGGFRFGIPFIPEWPGRLATSGGDSLWLFPELPRRENL